MNDVAATFVGGAVPESTAMQRPDALTFTPRKESWVASSRGWFYKIFRASDEPLRDWVDPGCTARAWREFTDTRFLHDISAGVCRPARLDHACIVYPHLSGPDLRALLQHGNPAARTAALRAALNLLARLHAPTDAARRYRTKDYARDVYLQPDAQIAARIAVRERTLFIGGFEARNFRYDRARGAWRFFDPQHMSIGVPEDDLARFVISLLMLNWGRGGSMTAWRAFEVGELVAIYEAATARAVDRALLAYCLRDTVAMRRFFAEKALRSMHGAKRVLGRAYLAFYFRQLANWVANHEL